MRSLPTILLALSLPAGAVAYAVAARVLQEMALPKGAELLTLLVPLFIAGLVMMPFLIPYFDRKATEDLAAYRRSQEAAADSGEDPDHPDDLDPPEDPAATEG